MRVLLLFILCSVVACSNNKESKKSTPNPPEIDMVAFLDTIWRTEQSPIRTRDSLGRIHGFESDEYQAQNEVYKKNHAINERKVIELLETSGWPDQDVVGEQGILTICNVIQHAENDIRLKYLPMMRIAVKEGDLTPRLLARAEDRIATERGDLQIYGGQIKYYPETQSFDVWPILDPANVDKRRAEIGLEPMSDFLAGRRENLEWNLADQIKRSEEFLKNKE